MVTPLQIQTLPRAVLFDYDGVLVASEPIHLLAWLQLLDELGLPPDRTTIQNAVGRTAPEILSGLLDRHRPGWVKGQKGEMGEKTEAGELCYDVHFLAQRKNDFYGELAKKELFVYPGVEKGLQWLKSQGIAIAIVSNAKRRELERTSSHLLLASKVDLMVSRDDVGVPKPSPQPYLFAAAALGVEVQDCVAVEDSPTGLEAALIAQVPTAAVLTNFTYDALAMPVPGRPDLVPQWIGGSIQEFFRWLEMLPKRT